MNDMRAIETAIFDVDGTLTTHDSLPLLIALALKRRPSRALVLLVNAPLIAFLVSRSAARAKERLLGTVLRGMRRDELCALGDAVASRLALSTDLRPLIDEHRRLGHDVWLASASIEPVVGALAERVGATGHVATRLAFDHGVCTGRFAGANCKGNEKLRRLDEVLEDGWRELAIAYSDSKADQPLMDAASACRWVRRGMLR